MANEKARTHSVDNAAAAVYAFPSDPDSLVGITNIGANHVWISHHSDVAAVEGTNCEVILPGITVYVPWNKTGISMRAATAATKVVMCNALGRNRL